MPPVITIVHHRGRWLNRSLGGQPAPIHDRTLHQWRVYGNGRVLPRPPTTDQNRVTLSSPHHRALRQPSKNVQRP